MKRFCLVLFVIISAMYCSSQNMPTFELIKEFEVGKGPDKIEWMSSVYSGFSPKEIGMYSGRNLWIAETKKAKLFNIKTRKIDTNISYPWNPRGGMENGGDATFTADGIFINNSYLLRHPLNRAVPSIDPPVYYQQIIVDSKLYFVRGYIFFYGGDGLAYAVNPQGLFLQNDTVRELLTEWMHSFWYSESEKRTLHVSLVNSGKYIIIDGIFYPAKAKHLYEYFSQIGIPLDSLQEFIDNNDTLKGISMNGDMYWGMGGGKTVINQEGEIVAFIDDRSIVPTKSDPRFVPGAPDYDNISNTSFAVHPNGDIYAIYAIKDEVARLYKAEKSWGPDLIGMARAGFASGGERALREKLQAYSPVELRILRNAIMAIHNYAFKGKDLTDYFLGYDWYEPDPSVKNDTAILTPDQKRLFDLVLAIEKERVLR